MKYKNKTVHPLLKWSGFRITSALLLTAYAIILACSWESRSAHWVTMSSILVVLLILTHFVINYANRNLYTPPYEKIGGELVTANPWYKRSWLWGLLISVFVAYVGLLMLLSTSWLKLDDFIFMGQLLKSLSLEDRWDAAVCRYSTWVARFGDFFNVLFPLAENRWQVWIINPAVVVSIPFALHRLFRRSNEETMASPKGVSFFWFCFFLFLLCNVRYWRPFWCYTAAANYLWPSTAFLWLLSCFNPANWGGGAIRTELATIGCFLLAFICGWGMECTAVSVVPLLVLWVVIISWRKVKLPAFCWAGVLGVVWGGYTLFASTSHENRTKVISRTRELDVNGMTPEQITQFVQNMDWDKINLLKGFSNNISLQGIPLHQHTYFIPYAWDRFWDAAQYPFVISCVALVSIMLSNRCLGERWRILASGGILLLGILIGFTYLAAAIPTVTSYLPCAMTVATAGALLYFSHSSTNCISARQITGSLAVALVALMIFIPAGVEAWKLTPYRDAQLAYIHEQKSMGVDEIVLPYPFPSPIKNNTLVLIGFLNKDKTKYPNLHAAKTFGVKSIRQLPYHKPSLSEKNAPQNEKK